MPKSSVDDKDMARLFYPHAASLTSASTAASSEKILSSTRAEE